ncbi:MAG TPA: 16S rRNA (guanine(527)-N(7))-methyltransferase RsmG [Symbiobacteriaceae bacterium]
MEPGNLELLREGLKGFGLSPEPEQVQAMVRHLELVADWNQRINLTAVTEEREMVIKHLLDSASVLTVLRPQAGSRLLDVGSGAGFPGLTIKCLVPAAEVVLLESMAKRCRFLEAAVAEVMPLLHNPGGIQVVWARAEDAARRSGFREAFDGVVARAVAEMRVLSEYCLPFCRVGGEFVAMKGPGVHAELEAARRAITLLGGEIAEVRELELPDGAGSRTLVRIRKVQHTPGAYPRKAGIPARNPL